MLTANRFRVGVGVGGYFFLNEINLLMVGWVRDEQKGCRAREKVRKRKRTDVGIINVT